MDFPDDLRSAEETVKKAEIEFLAGNDGIAEALLVEISTGTFATDAETARERMQNLDESRYVKWSRWEKRFEFSAAFWKDEGYPRIDTTTLQARNPDWYSKRTGTAAFVKDLMIHRDVLAPTVDGTQKGTPTPPGEPSNRWLLDFVALSSLRLSFKSHWEQLVGDIVKKRSQTSLVLVAERLGLTISEILDIARRVRDFDDRVVERDVGDSTKNLMYLCRKPDPSLTPLVDITG
ncbi:MAG: hypothetical protein JSW61_03420 [Candidatus Thorarchaeota archaeon]|nr:MAG: hypothetical protein JSW61_03420 [Candidatus Thorarchaeota archaeon]